MLSNKLRKQIQQLKLKKFRKQYNLFVAEGEKVVLDLLSAEFIPEVLLATKGFASIEPFRITTQEMRSITHFSSPSPIMGVFQIPNHTIDSVPTFQLVLDQIKDPGNLGTIIRTSDWYGLSQIVCSLDCVDCFNPKVVQATMGSIARVKPILDWASEAFFLSMAITCSGALFTKRSLFNFFFTDSRNPFAYFNSASSFSFSSSVFTF